LNAGPSVIISFIISGFVAALAALSYSELATMIPVSGSAYSYSYATLGELMAWIVGWDLILECELERRLLFDFKFIDSFGL